jgi:hypothetical protein
LFSISNFSLPRSIRCCLIISLAITIFSLDIQEEVRFWSEKLRQVIIQVVKGLLTHSLARPWHIQLGTVTHAPWVSLLVTNSQLIVN